MPLAVYRCLGTPPLHPVCLVSTDMAGDDCQRLLADIRANGQRVPILVWRDHVVDGRHRLRALEQLASEGWREPDRHPEDLAPLRGMYAELEPAMSEMAMIKEVLRLNAHRRHMTTTDRAMMAARVTLLTIRSDDGAILPPVTVARAAVLFRVSERTVKDARAVTQTEDPELLALLSEGTALYQVAKRARAEREARAAAEAAPRPDDAEPGETTNLAVQAARARIADMRFAEGRRQDEAGRALRAERAALARYESTGRYSAPNQPERMSLFDPVEGRLGRWEREVGLATRRMVETLAHDEHRAVCLAHAGRVIAGLADRITAAHAVTVPAAPAGQGAPGTAAGVIPGPVIPAGGGTGFPDRHRAGEPGRPGAPGRWADAGCRCGPGERFGASVGAVDGCRVAVPGCAP